MDANVNGGETPSGEGNRGVLRGRRLSLFFLSSQNPLIMELAESLSHKIGSNPGIGMRTPPYIRLLRVELIHLTYLSG